MKGSSAVRQALLRTDDGEREMRCWIDADSWRVEPGYRIILKELRPIAWTVIELGEQVHDKNELYRPWRVGGLV